MLYQITILHYLSRSLPIRFVCRLAYQDFLAQRDYPYLQVQRLSGIGGQPSASGTGTRVETAPGVSGTAQALGALSTGVGILDKTGAFGPTGWLGLKDGGPVTPDGKRNIKHPMHGLGWLKDVR